jgi:hypothetical protein
VGLSYDQAMSSWLGFAADIAAFAGLEMAFAARSDQRLKIVKDADHCAVIIILIRLR